MEQQDPLVRSVAAMSRLFVGDGSLKETLDRVAVLAQEALPAADIAGITMLVDGRAKTAVFTDHDAPEIDSAQYETAIGPCLDAFRHQQVFQTVDTMNDDQWPQFSEAAAAHGVRSTLSLPLIVNHEGVGALNFYPRTPDAFADGDIELGSQFAAHAAIVLANAQAYWDAHQLGEDLATAMRSRAVIEQAKGILMGAQRCGPDEAFQLLVRASQRENRKLRDIAEELVARTQHRTPP